MKHDGNCCCETCKLLLLLGLPSVFGKSPHTAFYRGGQRVTAQAYFDVECERRGSDILRRLYGVTARLERRAL